MALNLRERFGPKGPAPRKVLAEDYEFAPTRYPALRDYKIERDELEMLETPLAVDRRYVLSHGPNGLQIEFVLCLSGSDVAVDLLFQRASAFQRQPGAQSVADVAATQRIGEIGIAWLWSEKERTGVLAFVRHNVLVVMQGEFAALHEQARELDADLARRQTSTEYADTGTPLLKGSGESGVLSVTAGGRVDLGLPASSDAHFFLSSAGSVNLDPADPTRRYYRAGLEKGTQTIVIYRVGRGLLPARQTIEVRIS